MCAHSIDRACGRTSIRGIIDWRAVSYFIAVSRAAAGGTRGHSWRVRAEPLARHLPAYPRISFHGRVPLLSPRPALSLFPVAMSSSASSERALIEDLSLALVREYLAKKKYKTTLETLQAELVRPEERERERGGATVGSLDDARF